MRASLTLELCLCLIQVPFCDVQVSYIEIQGFCYYRACRDGPVGPMRSFILSMTFEQDTDIDHIDFCDTGVIDVIEEAVEKKMEVSPASWSSIVIVINRHPIEISDIGFHFL